MSQNDSVIDQMLQNHNSDTLPSETTTENSTTTESETNHTTTTDSPETLHDSRLQSPEEKVLAEIDACYEDCSAGALDALPKENIHIEVTNRFKRLHGQCKYNRDENGNRRRQHHLIRIASSAIEHDTDWRDTVRHELAHAAAYAEHGTSQGHNSNWKAKCIELGAEPTRCAEEKHTTGDYMLTCPNQCWTTDKHKRSKKIKQPWRYHCPDCGKDCISYDAGDTPPSEEGVCAVKSLNWRTRVGYVKHN